MADNEGGSGLGWFLAGLGVGTLIGVLYAPKAGKETREDILTASLEAKDKAAALVEQGKQRASEYVDQGKEYIEQSKQNAAELEKLGDEDELTLIVPGKQVERNGADYAEYVSRALGEKAEFKLISVREERPMAARGEP